MLLTGVHIGHTTTHLHGSNAGAVEHVGVGAAACGYHNRLDPKRTHRPRHQDDYRVTRLEAVWVVLAHHLHLGPGAVGRRPFLQRLHHGLGLRLELGLAAAARLPLDGHQVGHDVGGRTPRDDADVGRRLFIDAPQGHGSDRLGRHSDSVDAQLRVGARVGHLAVNAGAKGVLRRRRYHQSALLAPGV